MTRTVLIIDDHSPSVKLFKAVLQSQGINNIVSIDGTNAMHLAREYHPDLILMDINLPYLSGIEITRMLKADSDLSDIPVLAVTANAMKSDKESILEAGCDGYMSKPISVLNFIAVVKKYLTLGKFRITESMRTGHIQIDSEHDQIMALLNEFSTFEDTGDDHRCTTKLLELLEMMKNHIKNEEIIMEDLGYNKLDQQKKGHAYMLSELEKLISSRNSNNPSSNLTETLTNLLIENFFGDDMDFAEYFQAMQAS